MSIKYIKKWVSLLKILVKRLLVLIFLLFPKNSKKFIFVCNPSPNTNFTNDNAYLMSEYIRQNKKNYKIIRMHQGESIESIQKIFHLYTAKVLVVSSFFQFPRYLPNHLKVLILNYFIPFKLDQPFSIKYFRDLFLNKNIFYIGNSLYERDKVFKTFQFPKDNFKIIGTPRREQLIKNKEKIEVQEFFQINFKPSKIFLYAPTYRDKFVEPHLSCGQNLEKISDILGYPDHVLEEILVKNRAVCIVAMHTYLDENVEQRLQLKRLKNVYFLDKSIRLEKKKSIYDFFWSSDALITDYSSISFDYLLTDKPIIYNFFDIEEYKKYRGIVHEPVDEIVGGVQVRTKTEFLTAMQDILDNKDFYSSERKKVLEFVDEIKDRNKIMSNIFNFMES